MSKDVLIAKFKDVSYYLKHSIKKGLNGAKLTYVMVLLAFILAFQNTLAQTIKNDPEVKRIVLLMQEAIQTPDFNKLSEEEKEYKINRWIEALSDKIQKDYSENVKKGALVTAEQDVAFLENISKGIKEGKAVEFVKGLRQDLDKEKNIQQDNYQKTVNNIKDNNTEKGSIQYIGENIFATFTSTSKSVSLARDKSRMGLEVFINKNGLKKTDNNYKFKQDKQGDVFTTTAFMQVNK